MRTASSSAEASHRKTSSSAAPAPTIRPAHVTKAVGTPTFISGTVVNAANGNKLRGIVVTVRDAVHRSVILGRDVTDADGFFRIDITGEDYGMKLNGSNRGFETGWRACDRTVVPTWGAACQSPLGATGRVKLDRL